MLRLLRQPSGLACARRAARRLCAAEPASLAHSFITVGGRPVYFDQIGSSHLVHISEMDPGSAEYPLAQKAARALFTSGHLPAVHTNSFSALLRILDGAEDRPRRSQLLEVALSAPSRISEQTVTEVVRLSLESGLESLRSTVAILASSQRTIPRASSESIADALLSEGSLDEDRLIVFDLYKRHVLLLPPLRLLAVAPALARKDRRVDLCYLASLYHAGYPHVHLPLARLFRGLGDVEHALQEYHQHYDAQLEDPEPVGTFQYAREAEDVSLMDASSRQAFSRGCSLEEATKILKTWTLEMKDKPRSDAFQKEFPDLLGSIHIEIPEPPKK